MKTIKKSVIIIISSIFAAVNKKNLTRGNVGEFNPEDIKISQVSESEAKMMLQNGDGKSTGQMYQWVTLSPRRDRWRWPVERLRHVNQQKAPSCLAGLLV